MISFSLDSQVPLLDKINFVELYFSVAAINYVKVTPVSERIEV